MNKAVISILNNKSIFTFLSNSAQKEYELSSIRLTSGDQCILFWENKTWRTHTQKYFETVNEQQILDKINYHDTPL